MSILNDLIQPLLGAVAKGVMVTLNLKAVAKLVLFLLGPPERDEQIARLVDDAVKGGTIAESIDGVLALEYIKKLRAWAGAKIKE